MIETKRLLLRPFCREDARDLLGFRREPLVNCFACMRLSDLAQAEAEALTLSKDPFTFAIVLQENGKVIGQIDAHPETSQPDRTEDRVMDTFSPCWMLHPDYHGKGYAYEAAHAFFRYLFQEKNARRIYAYTEDYNLPSQKLCRKLGMRQEGLFREFVSFVNGPDGQPIYENTMQFAILKREWLERNEDTP